MMCSVCRPVMKTLSEVQWCPDAVKEKLAAKSLALNGGNPETLGKAEVRHTDKVVFAYRVMGMFYWCRPLLLE